MHALLILLPLFASSVGTPDIEFLGEDVMLPMDLSTGHAAVTVRINGGEPLLFQVDTYATIDACIDDDVAAALGLVTVGTVQNSDGMTTRQKNIVEIERLQCGGATFRNLRTLVDDYDWIKRSDGKKVSGLIGFTAFKDLLVTFDYPVAALVLQRGNLEAEAPHVIPFTTPRGGPDIDLVLGEQRWSFGIDTGHPSALSMLKSDAADLGLEESLTLLGQSRSVYSSFSIWGARSPLPVEFAGHRIDDLNLLFVEGKVNRLIGYDLLKQYTMTFDQERKLVSFVPGVL